MKYRDLASEENLKIAVAKQHFSQFNYSTLGKIDFCISQRSPKGDTPTLYFLWAEAKKGNSEMAKSLVQLILTIGKERSFEKVMPPIFLGGLDAEKIAFIPYSDIQDIFYLNDFNWNVSASQHNTKEFALIHARVSKILAAKLLCFNFEQHKEELQHFIKQNFIAGKNSNVKQQITKTNFIAVFQKWQKELKHNICIDWAEAKKDNIVDGDFYLADLLSENDRSIKENLFVILKNKREYAMNRHKTALGSYSSQTVFLLDTQAYENFWRRYHRPPKQELWDYMIDRRDLLVSADIRERKGSFYTPRQWVELSQKYLAEVFGENWQEEYIIWDCAAGTGNLLANLSERHNIYASTLDKADVEVMKELAKNKQLNLLPEHIFQFDFLNDEFIAQEKKGKLPNSLYNIINNPEKLRKLIIYINPPYAEATSTKTIIGTGENKAEVTTGHKIYREYKPIIGQAAKELFALFLIRVYKKLFCSKIANFSKLKNLQSSNFSLFRQEFRARLEKFFAVPANTFDNVKGEFPISFQIWDTEKVEIFVAKQGDFYAKNGEYITEKLVSAFDNIPRINQWISAFNAEKTDSIATLFFLEAAIFKIQKVFT